MTDGKFVVGGTSSITESILPGEAIPRILKLVGGTSSITESKLRTARPVQRMRRTLTVGLCIIMDISPQVFERIFLLFKSDVYARLSSSLPKPVPIFSNVQWEQRYAYLGIDRQSLPPWPNTLTRVRTRSILSCPGVRECSFCSDRGVLIQSGSENPSQNPPQI